MSKHNYSNHVAGGLLNIKTCVFDSRALTSDLTDWRTGWLAQLALMVLYAMLLTN